jgi:hypothetical protein
MKNFVLCYAAPLFVGFSDVLLSDTLLMPGGEIADDEMPEVAAARFLREVGLAASLPDIRIMGVVQHKAELVHVCHCPLRDAPAPTGAVWVPLSDVMKRDSKVPHAVKLAAALCRAGLTNWSFTNNQSIIGLNLEGWQ